MAVRRHAPLLSLAFLLACYVLLRLPHLDVLPPFDDESDYAWDALLLVAGVHAHAWSFLFVSLHDGVPPLSSWLVGLLLGLPLDPIVVVRLLSVVAGAATTALLYLSGRAWASSRAGLLAAGCYIVSPLTVFTDRIGLLDGQLAFWITLGAVLTWQASIASRRAALWWALAAGGALGAALLTKSLGLLGLLLPALAVWCSRGASGPGYRGRTRERWLATEVTYLVAVLVWSSVLLSGRANELLYPFALQSGIAHSPLALTQRLPMTLSTVGGYAVVYLTPGLAVVLGLALLGTLYGGRPAARFVAWWVLLAGAALLASAGAFFPSRYVVLLVPALFLCGGVAVDQALSWCGARRGVVVLSLLALAVLPIALLFDGTLLADPSRAPLSAVDRFQYITGWPSGYGLPAALARVRGAGSLLLAVDGATNPPFTQAQVSLRDSAVRVEGVALDRAVPCTAPGTFALLDVPRDSVRAFQRANPLWQRVATYPRPGSGGAYVLYRCAPGRPR